MSNTGMYKYLGKAKPDADGMAQYHLLPYHSLDVAAVGLDYLSLHESLSQYFYEKLNCSKDDCLNWAAFWFALHDLGKFSEAFPSQKLELAEYLQGKKYKKYCGEN